jgi:hypothetical protein
VRTEALTENFLPVELEGRLPANRPVKVKVNGVNHEGTLLAVPELPVQVQNAAMATSVCAKSVPLKSNSSPVSLARA